MIPEEIYVNQNKHCVRKRYFKIPGYDNYIVSDDGEVNPYNPNTGRAKEMLKFVSAKDYKQESNASKYIHYPYGYSYGYYLTDNSGKREYVTIPQVFNLAFCGGEAELIYFPFENGTSTYFDFHPYRKISNLRRFLNQHFNVSNAYALTKAEYRELVIEKCGGSKASFDLASKAIVIPESHVNLQYIGKVHRAMKGRCNCISALLSSPAYITARLDESAKNLNDFLAFAVPQLKEYDQYRDKDGKLPYPLELDKDMLQYDSYVRDYSIQTIRFIPRSVNDAYRTKNTSLPYSITITNSGEFKVNVAKLSGKRRNDCKTYEKYADALATARKNKAQEFRKIANHLRNKMPKWISKKMDEDADRIEAGRNQIAESCLTGRITITNLALARFLARHGIPVINIRDGRYKAIDNIRITKEFYKAANKAANNNGMQIDKWIISLMEKELDMKYEKYPDPTAEDIIADAVTTDVDKLCSLVEEWRENERSNLN